MDKVKFCIKIYINLGGYTLGVARVGIIEFVAVLVGTENCFPLF